MNLQDFPKIEGNSFILVGITRIASNIMSSNNRSQNIVDERNQVVILRWYAPIIVLDVIKSGSEEGDESFAQLFRLGTRISEEVFHF